jgi:endonuclease V-like protein UPF0215 family
MTRKFTVKREIRTLGLDLCEAPRLVCAVVRGGDFLDGVAILPADSRLSNTSIVSAIIQLRFFPELRLIMTHDPRALLDTSKIEKLAKLPVIEVDSTRTRLRKSYRQYRLEGKTLQMKSSLSTRILGEVLSTTWTTGTLPEPVRIAHLIARSRFFLQKSTVSKPRNKFAS